MLKWTPYYIFLKFFDHRHRTACIFFSCGTLWEQNLFYIILLNGCSLHISVGSNFREWYENSAFQAVDQVPSHCFRASTDDFPSEISAANALRRDHNYTHQFVFGQAKTWRWIPLHSSGIMHEHVFCLPDWGTFSNYSISGIFHWYKK